MSDENELLTLHGQLLAGDIRASSKIVERVLAPLIAIVLNEIGGLHDVQDAEQACIDALLDYLADPGKYDPQRARLITYLAAIAKGKGKTLRRSQQRFTRTETEFADRAQEEKELANGMDNETEMLRQIDWVKFGGELVKDPGDAEIVELMKVSAHSPATVAQAIGMRADQAGLAEASKRIERIRGRARRMAERKEA